MTPIRMHPVVLMEAHELNPAAYNPNKMAPSKYEALKESIRVDGFVDPIVVQRDGTNIIGGHHRLKAIKEICIEDGAPIPKIPCVVLDCDDASAKKLNLKLNHIKGVPDARLLGELLVDLFPLDSIKEEIPMLGLEVDDAVKYIRIAEPEAFPIPPKDVGGFGKSITLSIEFSDVRVRDQIKKALQQRVEIEKKRSGDIVAELLTLTLTKKRGRSRSATA